MSDVEKNSPRKEEGRYTYARSPPSYITTTPNQPPLQVQQQKQQQPYNQTGIKDLQDVPLSPLPQYRGDGHKSADYPHAHSATHGVVQASHAPGSTSFAVAGPAVVTLGNPAVVNHPQLREKEFQRSFTLFTVGVCVFVLAFATSSWMVIEDKKPTVEYGLWRICSNDDCSAVSNSDLSTFKRSVCYAETTPEISSSSACEASVNYWRTCRAFGVIALLCYIAAFFLGVAARSQHNQHRLGSRKHFAYLVYAGSLSAILLDYFHYQWFEDMNEFIRQNERNDTVKSWYPAQFEYGFSSFLSFVGWIFAVGAAVYAHSSLKSEPQPAVIQAPLQIVAPTGPHGSLTRGSSQTTRYEAGRSEPVSSTTRTEGAPQKSASPSVSSDFEGQEEEEGGQVV